METNRLLLSQFSEDHFQVYYKLRTDPERVSQNAVTTLDENMLRMVATGYANHWREHSIGPFVGALKERPEDGFLLVTLVCDRLNGEAKWFLGFIISKDEEGKGLVKEAAKAALSEAFARGLDEIHAITRGNNFSALAVLDSLGFECIKYHRRFDWEYCGKTNHCEQHFEFRLSKKKSLGERD